MLKQILFILLLIYSTLQSFRAIAEPYIRTLPSPTTRKEPKSQVKEYIYTVPSAAKKDPLATISDKKDLLPPPPHRQPSLTKNLPPLHHTQLSATKNLPPLHHTQLSATKNPHILYRVEVPGDSPKLLARVKKVEPRAFINHKGRFIQAGLYGNVAEAHQRAKQLTKVGLSAKTVKVYH